METTETISETRRLTRPRSGRWFGGVAAGLGAYFDLSPAIYRIAFVALSLAGGTGILLYIAAWAVIPEEGEAESVAAAALKRHRDRPGRAVGLALLAFVAVLALSSARFWPSPGNLWLAAALIVAALVWWQISPAPGAEGAARVPRGGRLFPIAVGGLIAVVGGVALLDIGGVWNVDWRIVLGVLVVACGALVAVGAATGRAVGAVAVLGVVLVAALGVALAVRVPIFAGVGDRVEHPASIATLDNTYKLGVGDFTVNLADVRLPVGTTRVKATLGVGDLQVHVPRNVTVVVDGRASAGQVRIFGQEDDGTSVHSVVTSDGSDPARVLVVDARVGLGQLEVVRG